MKFKRGISLALTLAILSSMGGPLNIRAAAADDSSPDSSDALAALGIDTSKAPDGFDKTDRESNPYGRTTMAVTPVYELYTVGLSTDALSAKPESTKESKTQELQTGTSTTTHEKETKNNTLQSNLYGNDDNSSTSAADLLKKSDSQSIAKGGTTTTTGIYTTISYGEATGKDKDDKDQYQSKDYLTGIFNARTTFSDGTSYAMADVVAGSFSTANSVQSDQIAMVYAGDYSADGGLYLRFGDARTGKYGQPKTLLSTDKKLGNPDLTDQDIGSKVENFAENPYQLKNYLQVAAGDWNGDGIDEVAVYVPEQGDSRIVIYAHTKGRGDADSFMNPDNWEQVWTQYFKEGSVVSNMISIVSGDVNQDGIDDLACTWGYYYGPEVSESSRAVVMFGGKGTSLLKNNQEFDLKYGSSNLVRASFAFGDLTGGGKTLILCAQADADLKAGKQNTRYVALYNWNGKSFTASLNQNFDLFAKNDEGKWINGAMVRDEEIISKGQNGEADIKGLVFHSLPLCAANTAIISRPTSGGTDGKKTDLLYFDSLVIESTDSGLSIKEARDQDTVSGSDYVEYSASAGAITSAVKENTTNSTAGSGTLFTLAQIVNNASSLPADKYTTTGKITVPNYVQEVYYKNWFHKLIRKKSYRWVQRGTKEIDGTIDHTEHYTQRFAGATSMYMFNTAENWKDHKNVNSSYALCLANTDKDTSYMQYTGEHRYVYSDPQVLAVLASPPYFSDLLNRDDLSGNYAESTTSFSSSTETETGTTSSSTISVGAYVSFEQEFSVFGVKIGQAEAEAQYTAGFTWETEQTSSLEQSIEYSASSGEDKVAFYSIPMEIYYYTSYVPDGIGNYKKINSTINIPHEASIGLLGLSEYEAIAEDYSVLPSISGSVLTHTIGDPSSYPSSPDGYRNKVAYAGTPARVGFTDKAGGDTITQSLTFSTSDSKSYSTSNSIETKAGAGAGGLTVGVVAGSESSSGKVEVNTEGSSFTGSLQQMPAEAEPYGYNMNWRIFCYNYRQGSMSFPVVTYAVTDVQAPSPLPEDFEQDISQTTEDSVTLTWTYDKIVSGFNLYRYYKFPDGSGSRSIGFVPFTSGRRDPETGKYTFSYTDTGLSPYTEYNYQIQTVNENKLQSQRNSIYSEPLTCLTKVDGNSYPIITVNNSKTDIEAAIFPDAQTRISVGYEKPEAINGEYKHVDYQWQKLNGTDWKDISGKTDSVLNIADASSADKGVYRCRLNIIYYDKTAKNEFSISAYSPSVTTVYSKRTPTHTLKIDSSKTMARTLELSAAFHKSAGSKLPTGTATFIVRGKDFSTSIPVTIGTDGKVSTSVSVPENGAYTVSLYYPGDKVFKGIDGSDGEMYIVGQGTGYQLSLHKGSSKDSVTRFTYGDAIQPSLSKKTSNTGALDDITDTTQFKYVVTSEIGRTDENNQPVTPTEYPLNDSSKPNVGTYTLYAYEGSEVVAETEFTVAPRAVTLRAVTPSHDIPQASVDPDKDIRLAADNGAMTAEEIAELPLSYTAVNSAGHEVTLHAGIDPSNYTITPGRTDATDAVKYANYDFTFVSGIYTVIGATYELNLEAVDFDGHSVASASIITSGNDPQKTDRGMTDRFAANTSVRMTVVPQAGYVVDRWELNGQKIADSENTVQITTTAEKAEVKVYFKTSLLVLTAQVSDNKGGTILCTNEAGKPINYPVYTSSGAKYTFTAVPDAGWHFKQWKRTEFETTDPYPTGTANKDGSNTLEIQAGKYPITLTAEFERDNYTLTLNGSLNARYVTKDAHGKDVTHVVTDSESIPGDTEITVAPKPGYTVADGAKYQVNDTQIEPNAKGEYIFLLTENTTISLDTTRSTCGITTTVDDDSHGTVSVLVDGQPVDDPSAIPGGSKVEIKAHANRGWHFAKWTINDKDVSDSSGVYTIDALDGALDIKAEFAQSEKHTANAAISKANQGTMQYTLYDIYGDAVEEHAEMPADGVAIYEGEEILFTVVPASIYTVDSWTVDGTTYHGNSRTNPNGRIRAEKNINATVFLKIGEQYPVYYTPASDFLSVTADDAAFASGTMLTNGSALQFTANIPSGQMIESWTITTGDLNADENTTPVQENGAAAVDPVFRHTLDSISTIRVHFTNYAANPVSILENSPAGSGKLIYTTPIQPNEDGKLNDVASADVRTNGTVQLTLTPAVHYVGTADEVKSVIASLAGKDAVVSVTETSGTFDVIIRNVTKAFEIDPADLFHATYAITVNTIEHGKITAPAARIKAGETVTLTAAPDDNYELKSLTLAPETKLNETASASVLTYTFTMPASDVTVSAIFSEKPKRTGGGGGGGGAGGGTTSVPADNSISIIASDGTKIPVKVNVKNGTAAVTADSTKLNTISGKDSLALALTDDKTVYAVSLPGNMVTALSKAENGITFTLPTGSIALDRATLTTLGTAAQDSDLLVISVKNADSTSLNDAQRKLMPKNGSLFDAVAYIQTKNGSQTRVHELSGLATITVPFTLGKNETADHLTAYYLADNGSFEKLPVTYDAKAGTASFRTSHFSSFAVTHEYSSDFTDVALDNWFYNEVNTALANGWFKGTSDTAFSPNTGMTRAMLVQVLYRMSGGTASANAQFSDVAADKWYAEAIAWASANGIVTGYANGTFKPDALVTRQQLAAILYRYDTFSGHTPTGSTALDALTDAASIEPWAADAMRWANSAGLVTGVTPTTLVPNGTATRAQVAVILSRYTGK